MRKKLGRFVAALCLVVLTFAIFGTVPNKAQTAGAVAGVARSSLIPAPQDILGFTPGDDRKLASWAKVIEYFQKLDAASDRVKFAELGRSTMGAPFVMATISAPENLKRLDEFRKIQELLADPRKLGPAGTRDRKAAQLIARGKTIVLITCGIHSDEVGSYLSSMLIAHRLASSNEPEIQEILKNTIILLVPSLNPDGVDIIKDWYDKTLGTPYEGTDPPMLYHKYTGHDNNRDWYAFTQVETQITVDKIHNVWHPQIVHDIHQQGEFGSRLFLPPYMQPVEPNVPKQIVEGYTELGRYMAREMRAAGFKGITTNSTYDAWSPSRAYSHYHGGVRILSETASCKIATPITIKFEELKSREGYDPKKESANFGPVWNGGEWHLRDITNNMTTAAFFLLRHAAQHREHWLQRFYEIGKEAVRPRQKGELWGWLIDYPINEAEQPTGLPADIWTHSGVEASYKQGKGFLIEMAQPYGSFAKALLEPQRYPDLRDPSGHPIPPYDVTAHTLSLLTRVQVQQLFQPVKFAKNKVYTGKPVEICGTIAFTDSKLGIYKSHVPSLDEGWTRWAIDSERSFHTYSYSSLEDKEVRAGNLQLKYKSIVIPDQPRSTNPDQPRNPILNGHKPGTMPPEYTGGLGEEGVKALREFVEQGGTLIFLNRASDFAIEQFKLPVRNVVAELPRTDFFVPGSILRIELDTSNPITKGMPKESIAWVENSPVFEVGQAFLPVSARQSLAQDQGNNAPERQSLSAPQGGEAASASSVHIIAWYPKDKDPLLSGWLLGGDRIKGKAALVQVEMGKGRIILFGFRPQYRGQSLATYPLFFNAISGK
ncbi:MAG TPA: M14 family metallopeptidase [Pyrinomonadaceae bacterium]